MNENPSPPDPVVRTPDGKIDRIQTAINQMRADAEVHESAVMSVPEYKLETDGLLFGGVFVRFDEMNQDQFKGAYQSLLQRSAYFEKQSNQAESRACGWRLAFWSLLVMLLIYWIAVPHHPVGSDNLDTPATVAE
jgi:hypothetical protein